MKDIGKKIKELREEKGWTQQELAEKCGYKYKSSINKLETQRDIPIKKVVPIANALGVTPQSLMGWDKVQWQPSTQEIEIKEEVSMAHDFYNMNDNQIYEFRTVMNDEKSREKLLNYMQKLSEIIKMENDD